MGEEHFGELFWEAGVAPAVQGREFFFYPGVPLHGTAPEHATLVGVIDSGVATDHPQLAGYVKACADFAGQGSADALGHGTAVALQLLYSAGVTNPPIAILSAKVTDAQGRIRQQAVVEAIDWAVQQGAVIVNLSLGFLGRREEYQALCAAIARHPDVQFVAAAGNYGPNVPVFPAACGHANLMSVGAAGALGEPAEYSGQGDVYGPGEARFLPQWAYHYEQGQALARAGSLQEARMAYQRSLAAQPNAESEFQLGVLDLNEGDHAVAVGHFLQAIALNPALAEAHEMLGAARLLAGEYRGAEEALHQAIKLYPQGEAGMPHRARAHFNLGQALVHLGRRGDARREFETVKALMPDYPRIDAALRAVAESG